MDITSLQTQYVFLKNQDVYTKVVNVRSVTSLLKCINNLKNAELMDASKPNTQGAINVDILMT